ncbi:MAG: Flp family type IVb pilin, partial [Deltaproteobacteria bacterium]|nr:Flp family type IVb pilin [Deltaproteobacteria bacterium]
MAFQAEEAGSTAIEYALIAVLVVLSALLGLTAMSGSMNELFKESDGSITT